MFSFIEGGEMNLTNGCHAATKSFKLQNENLKTMKTDVLYHLALSTETQNLAAMFGDVKFVCMGGTNHRMREFAEYMAELLGHKEKLYDITEKSHRYAMYKVGPLLSVSHGIGIPSMTVLLQEILKLLHHAKVSDPIIFRIGTSGGIHVEPGSVVVSTFGLNGMLERSYDLPILGKMVHMPTQFDTKLAQDLLKMSQANDQFHVVSGGTMAADDFYQGQGRTDGPFCSHSEEEKFEFLEKLHKKGVRNIEMECTAFAAFTTQAGVKAADICVTLVDRMKGDQVTTPKEVLLEWQKRPMIIAGRYIMSKLNQNQ